MKTVYVDADACPVKDEVMRVADRHDIPVVLVSNRGFRTGGHPLLRSVVVEATPDAADNWIAAEIMAGDICVTNDVPLAARCVEKDATAIAPNGKVFDTASIGMALAMRDLMTDLRETGDITGGGPKGFTAQDRSRFLNILDALARKP
ncbi:MAG: YaiI/YqxD family protein [Rhodospirillaceae bacterium]|nr:YaiI/YqxD family protein [Rhodospirillaceae bacterium]